MTDQNLRSIYFFQKDDTIDEICQSKLLPSSDLNNFYHYITPESCVNGWNKYITINKKDPKTYPKLYAIYEINNRKVCDFAYISSEQPLNTDNRFDSINSCQNSIDNTFNTSNISNNLYFYTNKSTLDNACEVVNLIKSFDTYDSCSTSYMESQKSQPKPNVITKYIYTNNSTCENACQSHTYTGMYLTYGTFYFDTKQECLNSFANAFPNSNCSTQLSINNTEKSPQYSMGLK